MADKRIGNEFWKLRSKHGRDSIIQDPETLAIAADEYFKMCLDNPLTRMDFKGKDAEQVEYIYPKPFKKGEFARFCGLSEWRLIEDLKSKSKDFTQIITYIEGTIFDQKYEYAAIGVYNTNLIARDLGMADKVDSTIKVTKKRVGFGARD